MSDSLNLAVVIPAFKPGTELEELVRAHGRPWSERYPAAGLAPDWYVSYGT